MSRLKNIFDQQRRPVSLGPLVGRGGEGAVFEIVGAPATVAKIYHEETARQRQQKIAAMIASGIQARVSNAAFPVSPLFDGAGAFAGFTMQRIGKQKPVHQLYSPASRRNEFPNADYRLLVRTALNIAKAVGGVHAAGCVIGDLNHSGVLVGTDATATLIDCDSFQFSKDGRTFYCAVGVPDYTPPELQGKSLANISRTQNHDAFGLGVAIFSLLFLGRHPFSGRYLGRGDMPEEKAIAEYRFAYSADRSRTQTEPPPFGPTLSYVPKEMAAAFEACFGPVGSNSGRPKPSDWVSLLQGAERQIVKCTSAPGHFHFSAAPECPWCGLEKAIPGFIAFPSPLVINKATPPNLGQLIAAIRGVANPGVAPTLISAMPAIQVVPNAQNKGVLDSSAGQFLVSTLAGIASSSLLKLGYVPPLLSLGGLGVSAYFALRNPKQQHANSPRAHQLKQAWDQIDLRYKKEGDALRFNDAKRSSETHIRDYSDLPAEESRRMGELSSRHREIQLTHYLERFNLINARIRGIGNGRTATLRSYGIDTAADVDSRRIQGIPGFGPATAGLLLSWRAEHERRFVFNPNQPINPSDVARVKSDIGQRRLSLETALKSDLIAVRTAAAEIQRSRTDLTDRARSIWTELKQAEADEKTRVFGDVVARRWIFGVACVAAFLVSGTIADGYKRAAVSAPSAPTQKATSVAPAVPNSSTWPSTSQTKVITNVPSAQPVRPPQVSASSASTQKATSVFPTVPSSSAGPSNSQSKVASPDAPSAPPLTTPQVLAPVQPSASTFQPVLTPQPNAGELNIPQDRSTPTPDAASDIRSAARPSTDTGVVDPPAQADPTMPAQLTSRLRELGFARVSESSWSTGALAALREFKIINRLPADSQLDTRTTEALQSPKAVSRSQSFLGGWATERACSQGPQLTITTREARSEGGACSFDAFVPARVGWAVRATCQVGAERWPTTISLAVAGNALSWSSSAKGNATYYRCR